MTATSEAEVFPISEGEELRVEAITANGLPYVNVRRWYRKNPDEEWTSTRKGFALSPDLAKQVAAAMLRAAEESRG